MKETKTKTISASNGEKIQACKALLLELARVNAEASIGNYNPDTQSHPSILLNKSLHETHRGWSHSENKGKSGVETIIETITTSSTNSTFNGGN